MNYTRIISKYAYAHAAELLRPASHFIIQTTIFSTVVLTTSFSQHNSVEKLRLREHALCLREGEGLAMSCLTNALLYPGVLYSSKMAAIVGTQTPSSSTTTLTKSSMGWCLRDQVLLAELVMRSGNQNWVCYGICKI